MGKVLSVKQPWASLIVHGIKDIENRTWKCPKKYIGTRVLIHASLTPAFSTWDTLNNEQTSAKDESYLKDIDVCALPLGAIIGSVEIVGCVLNHSSIWAEKTSFPDELDNKCTWNWILANPILFDNPIENVKGKLGLWNLDIQL